MATVWIPTPYRDLVDGVETVVVEGSTVRQITRNLDVNYPGFWERLVDDETDRIRAGVSVVINGVVVGTALHEPVRENDEVHYLPAIAGGQP
ncbi:MAG: MoaD/ThiS family protein [Chloroflexota bacterium]|nr:MoaD/ThiS family protein [Chloroflexota bacterium]